MIQPTTQAARTEFAPAQNYGPALAILTTLFFMWGFVTVLNDILVPHLKNIFELSYTQIMLIQFTFFSAYFIMSLPSSRIIHWLGYQRSIVTGLSVMGVGALLFLPAASMASYPLFLFALYVLASGVTLLQVAANPYVAELGDPAKASSRLTLAQALNSLGTTIGPYLGGMFILSAAKMTTDQLHALTPAARQAHQALEASSVRLPYLGISILLFLLAIVFWKIRLPILAAIDETASSGNKTAAPRSVWSYRHLVLGAVGIFVYVGAEVSIGSFLVSYFTLSNIGGLNEQQAALYVSFYWGGAMVGRFIGSWLMRIVSPGLVLGGAAIASALLVVVSIVSSGPVAMWSIILVGLFNSVMFPTIFTLGIDGLGKMTAAGSGLLVMAIVGGAILPVIQGALADKFGVQLAFILPALLYLYIVFYGFVGSKHPELETT